jgi:ABC-type lipoprotein export system ATPase subunit
MALNVGSEWHRWDVHIHTPITTLNNQYKNCTWDQFIKEVNNGSADVIALGITDYYSIDSYILLKRKFEGGAFDNIKLLFPNIEMRLAIPTENSGAINIHLIISPDDPHHIEEINHHLNRLHITHNDRPVSCNRSELIRFGNEINPRLTSDEQRYELGIENFKIDFSVFADWYNESKWFKDNALIALSAKQSDGTSALSYKGGFAAKRHEIEKKADIIFSSAPSDIQFWLGEGKDSEAEIIKEFGSLKPCLMGSDAHSIREIFFSETKKYCWIKAEPTFEGFKQILYEPKERVFIGEFPPSINRKNYLSQIYVPNTNWFPDCNIPINKGLVSIIGPRGSGKTALLDIISVGLSAYEDNDASFIAKAQNLALPLTVDIEVNKSGRMRSIDFNKNPERQINAKYLSQHFVEQLCSTEGASQRLVKEIENYIFDKLEAYKKQDANDFSELKNDIILSYDNDVTHLTDEIKECSNEITRITDLRSTLKLKNNEIDNLNKEIAQITLPKINKDEELTIASQQEKYNEEYQIVNVELKELRRKGDILKNVVLRIEGYNQDLLEKGKDMIEELSVFDLTKEEKELFSISFSQSLIDLLNKKKNNLQTIFYKKLGTETDPEEKTYYWYKKELEKIKISLESLSFNERKYIDLNKQIQEKSQKIKNISTQIDEIKKLNIEYHQKKRIEKYKKIFNLVRDKCNALSELYGPLENSLKVDYGEKIPLSLYVKIDVNLKTWIEKGNAIIDSRYNSKIKAEGGLREVAKKVLLEPWKAGDPDTIADAMNNFINNYIAKDVKDNLLREHCTLNDLAQWLFSTDHISTPYEIKYEGVSIEKLSPGTRGIVLMILFLKIDRNDIRPLLIDQPEDNLDPASVYEKLVPYFKEVKNRRQIIMVTHNPNLVVGTDSDQVIVASSSRVSDDQLPQFNYISGGLEDPKIIENVCNILEGGEMAIEKRLKRYFRKNR